MAFLETHPWVTQKFMYTANIWGKGEGLAAIKEENLVVPFLPYACFLCKRGMC